MNENRYLFIINFIICVVLSGVAFFYNYVEGIRLCPLCSLQLICYYIIGMISLIAFFHIPEKAGRYTYAILLLIFTILGILFSSRQVWLQQTAHVKGMACAPSLLHMLANFPLSQAWQMTFSGNDACTLVNWQFIGFSMAAWSLFFFIILLITGLLLLFHANREPVED